MTSASALGLMPEATVLSGYRICENRLHYSCLNCVSGYTTGHMEELARNEVIARLERLERENRRLKRFVAIAVLLGGALLLMAQAPARPRTLEAEKLIIRYPNGKEGIVLQASDDGSGATATIKHPNGVAGITLEAAGRHGSGAYFFPDA